MATMRSITGSTSSNGHSEASVKAAFLNRMRQARVISRRSVVASELVLGRSGVRADLAIFLDELVGVEIKTERDTLRRLSRQLAAYRLHCDKVVLILAEKHLKAAELLPIGDVELWSITSDGTLELMRAADKVENPSALLPLLTAAEHRRLDRTIASRRHVSAGFERKLALASLRARFAQSSAQFWQAVGRGRIYPEHLVHLSRFRSARQEAAERRDQEAQRWEAWERQAQQVFSARSPIAA